MVPHIHQSSPLGRNKKSFMLEKMGIIRRKATPQLFSCSNVFAIAVCLFVSSEMASAWINKCNPGDLFIDSTNSVSPASCDNGYCTNWCRDLCSGMGTVATQDRCKIEGGTTCCKCCCKEPPVYLPPDDSDWGGLAPGDNNNCTSEQTFLTLRRTDGITCKKESICDAECSKKGLVTQRTECVANSNDVPGKVYNWYEQCCCGPPPPPPCPTPCPCPDYNITISIKSGQASCCEHNASPPSSTCAAVL